MQCLGRCEPQQGSSLCLSPLLLETGKWITIRVWVPWDRESPRGRSPEQSPLGTSSKSLATPVLGLSRWVFGLLVHRQGIPAALLLHPLGSWPVIVQCSLHFNTFTAFTERPAPPTPVSSPLQQEPYEQHTVSMPWNLAVKGGSRPCRMVVLSSGLGLQHFFSPTSFGRSISSNAHILKGCKFPCVSALTPRLV